ncbi:GGDEF domain protein [alpha proteobacterium U9-1i]|nr:GGDEF domain protein [alpha proteobacterium U9-1i]
MALGFGKSGSGTTRALLERYGLKPRDLSDSGLRAFEQLAAERDDLAEKLAVAEDLADRDTLTPAFNRRAFIRELHRTMSAVERYKTPAAVIYLDLDGLKALNDGFGHAAGDAALCHVGRLLTDMVRESDIVGRLGGDEFGVILNYASAEEAQAKADALSQAINLTPIMHAGQAHRVAVSLGVHAIAFAEDPETVIARADEAMYADKYARRAEAQKFAGF